MNDKSTPVLVLFRHDLRIADNRALSAAADSGKPVIAAFILDEESKGIRPIGGARRWWLHHSLLALSKKLKKRGVKLHFLRGIMSKTVETLQESTKADLVFWNKRYDPAEIDADLATEKALQARGVTTDSFDGHLLHDPDKVKTGAGREYRVYTPFWRELAKHHYRDPVDAPEKINGFDGKIQSENLDDWKLLPTKPDWSGGLGKTWTPGEESAHERLADFLDETIDGYGENRELPGIEGTSGLSPHLAHGEITPFQIFAAMSQKRVHAKPADIETFRKEICWREFCYHQLYHNRDLATVNYNRSFDAFPWKTNEQYLQKWQKGQTGYSLVDAAMRQLWEIGWMHNRVRMVTASFLIKHLLVDWRVGEQWFWDTLVDADPASNAANWQWVAGSGADASPYFRIFNPILQARKFDAKGDYIRRFVPELENVSDDAVHEPSGGKGKGLFDTYPEPVVDHRQAREDALSAYEKARKA
ncbi:deoxyribodipyrimidine photo-lyase [Mesorhizobium sp. SB112]|uniref:cryptochrome/photolyase family protein n=1 Tax=Mesorhizobium sp. SB112 TaxID=3151853 RepID=UPI0032631FA9